MKFKGFTGTLAKNLSYRLSMKGDVLANGSEIDERYIAIVHKKDCPEYVSEKDGKTYIDPSNAPAIKDMSGHSTTKLVYGCWKKRKVSERGTYVELDNGKETFVSTGDYYQCNVYFVNNGRVYKASIRRFDSPTMRALFAIQNIEHSEKRSTSYEEKLDIRLLNDAITREQHDSMLSKWQETKKTLV